MRDQLLIVCFSVLCVSAYAHEKEEIVLGSNSKIQLPTKPWLEASKQSRGMGSLTCLVEGDSLYLQSMDDRGHRVSQLKLSAEDSKKLHKWVNEIKGSKDYKKGSVSNNPNANSLLRLKIQNEEYVSSDGKPLTGRASEMVNYLLELCEADRVK